VVSSELNYIIHFQQILNQLYLGGAKDSKDRLRRVRGAKQGGFKTLFQEPEDAIKEGDPVLAYVDFEPKRKGQNVKRVLCCLVVTELKHERKKKSFVPVGHLRMTKLKGQLLSATTSEDQIVFGEVHNTKQVELSGAFVCFENMDTRAGRWTISKQRANMIAEEIKLRDGLAAPYLKSVEPVANLPYHTYGIKKRKSNVLSFKYPFPGCVELKGVAANPGAVRKHIACHAVLGHVPNGEQKREAMQYCIVCGYTIKQCTLRKQIGKFSGRPVVKCGTGKPFGSWSKKLTANKKNTVSVNFLHRLGF